MKDGVIADYKVTEAMLRYYMKKAMGGWSFVKPEVHLGLIPRLQWELAKQRNVAKARKAAASSSLEKAVFDGEQLAVKVIMNSLYGMLGSPTASIPCVEIASTITAMGRHNLMSAKAYVEEKYCLFTGEPRENAATVIYGDTVGFFLSCVCVSWPLTCANLI